MSSREAYQQKLEGKLKEWKADFDKLKARAEQSSGDAWLEGLTPFRCVDAMEPDAVGLLGGVQDLDRVAVDDADGAAREVPGGG